MKKKSIIENICPTCYQPMSAEVVIKMLKKQGCPQLAKLFKKITDYKKVK